MSLSKSGKLEREPADTAAAGPAAAASAETPEGEPCAKENSDTTNEPTALDGSAKKTVVAAVQKKAAGTLDKKRSLKRL